MSQPIDVDFVLDMLDEPASLLPAQRVSDGFSRKRARTLRAIPRINESNATVIEV
jgi:hypothetical protein